jgi:predicted RNA-binding protein with PIN domain
MASGRHLLVDGSNIAHAWPELRTMLARSRPAAHARLERALSTIHDHEGVRVTLVFDGSGKELDLRCPSASQTFSVVRTPTGMPADAFIEGWVGRSVPASDCWVATGDMAEGRTIEGLGGHWISPDDLSAWVRRSEAMMGSNLAGRVRANDRNWKLRP